LYKPVPAGKVKLERGHLSQSNCISPESPERQLIEEIEFSVRLERAYKTRQSTCARGHRSALAPGTPVQDNPLPDVSYAPTLRG
jgi:hypothetical protein